MAWKTFFRLKPNSPYVFVHNGVKLNMRNALIPLDRVLKAWRTGCQYLELTAKGREKFAAELILKPLPDQLPADLLDKDIEIIDPNQVESSGSGSGAVEAPVETVEVIEPEMERNTEAGATEPGTESTEGASEAGKEVEVELTAEQVITISLERGFLTAEGNFYNLGGQKYGTKAILKKTEVIEALRQAIQ